MFQGLVFLEFHFLHLIFRVYFLRFVFNILEV